MASKEQLSKLQASIGHSFTNIAQLQNALTAAHRIAEYSSDGNRGLAYLGNAMIRAYYTDKMFAEGASRSIILNEERCHQQPS